MTRFNLVLLLTTLMLSCTAKATAFTLPNHPSCEEVKRYVHRVMNSIDRCSPKNDPVIISDGQCHAEYVTTDQDYPRRIYNDVMPLARANIAYLAHNYKEMISQHYYDIQAAEGFDSVRSIEAFVEGQVDMQAKGTVGTDGYVPVTLSGFNLLGKGVLKASPATVSIFMRMKNVQIHGRYNVFTGQLEALPNLTNATPEVWHEVKVPWVFRTLQQLTPRIMQRILAEVGRFAERLARAIGLDMSYDLPQRLVYQAQINPDVVVPLQGLQNRRPGDVIDVSFMFDDRRMEMKDNQSYFRADVFPVCAEGYF